MKGAGTARAALARVHRRLGSERWIMDVVRRSPPSRWLRGRLEWLRGRKIVAMSGSVDAALDAIVRDAVGGNAAGPTDRHSAATTSADAHSADANGVVGGSP